MKDHSADRLALTIPPARIPHHESGEIDAAAALATIWRQRRLVLMTTGACLSLAIIYLMMATPKYAGVAALMIDTRRIQLFQQAQDSVTPDPVVDAAAVESQVEALKSERLATRVIQAMHLDNDPEFIGEAPDPALALLMSIYNGLINLFSGNDTPSDPALERMRSALAAYGRGLDVKRAGTSYVIEISFKSKDRTKAAKIANGIAETYIKEQNEFRINLIREAGHWLEGRMSELRTQASRAETTVQAFRSENNLIDANGKSVTDQQLSELTTQLANVRSDMAQAKAKLARIKEIMEGRAGDASSVADTLKNEVILRIRQQYVDTQRREAEWSARYGTNHIAAVNLRAEMKHLEAAIQDELARIAKTYESDVEIARSREEALNSALDKLYREVNTGRQAQVRLRELESSAISYRTLHDSFMQRYLQAVQQQSSPMTESRIVGRALPPKEKASPRTLLVIAGAFGAGIFLGVGGAFFRETLDRRIRTSPDSEAATGVPCLGVMPLVQGDDIVRCPQTQPSAPGAAAFRVPLLRHALDAPFSQFAEALRSVKVSVDARAAYDYDKGRVIGIVSTVPSEGKTTAAVNFSLITAATGRKVLLIDGDLRNPALTRALQTKPQRGLIDVLLGRIKLEEASQREPQTGLVVLPVIPGDRVSHSNEVISSFAMREFLEKMRSQFDYIVVDLPPIGPIVDARAAADLIDEFVLVVGWGATAMQTVKRALIGAPGIRRALIGHLLNRVDLKAYRDFESDGGFYYTPQQWERYGGKAA
jgi:succinoglycan biosynthesis transport protein ExoP